MGCDGALVGVRYRAPYGAKYEVVVARNGCKDRVKVTSGKLAAVSALFLRFDQSSFQKSYFTSVPFLIYNKYFRKCLFARSVRANFSLNAHSVRANFSLNAHSVRANFGLNAHSVHANFG